MDYCYTQQLISDQSPINFLWHVRGVSKFPLYRKA